MIFWKKTHQNLGFLGCLHVFTPTFSDQIWRQPFCCPCSSQPRPAPAPRRRCALAAPSRPVPFLRPSPPFRRRQAPGRWPWGGKCWGHPGPGPPGWKRRSRSQQLGGIGSFGLAGLGDSGEKSLGLCPSAELFLDVFTSLTWGFGNTRSQRCCRGKYYFAQNERIWNGSPAMRPPPLATMPNSWLNCRNGFRWGLMLENVNM